MLYMIRPILILIFCSILVLFQACNSDDNGNHSTSPSPIPAQNDSTVNVSDTAEVYKELVSEMEQPDRVIWQKPDLVMSKFGSLDGKTVADIGAGTGYFSFRLARKGAKVIAIDIDPNAVAWMELQKKLVNEDLQQKIDIRLATEDDPNLFTKEADMVLMVNTYIYLDDRVQYLQNLKKGLKPGARIVIIDFKKKNTPIGPSSDERLSLLEVEKDLLAADFSILDSDDTTLDYQYIVTATMN